MISMENMRNILVYYSIDIYFHNKKWLFTTKNEYETKCDVFRNMQPFILPQNVKKFTRMLTNKNVLVVLTKLQINRPQHE